MRNCWLTWHFKLSTCEPSYALIFGHSASKTGREEAPQTVPSRLHLLHRTKGLGRAHLRISSDLVA